MLNVHFHTNPHLLTPSTANNPVPNVPTLRAHPGGCSPKHLSHAHHPGTERNPTQPLPRGCLRSSADTLHQRRHKRSDVQVVRKRGAAHTHKHVARELERRRRVQLQHPLSPERDAVALLRAARALCGWGAPAARCLPAQLHTHLEKLCHQPQRVHPGRHATRCTATARTLRSSATSLSRSTTIASPSRPGLHAG
eukprot:211128-Chlamydomonas_euryale.AAC.8